MKIPGTKINIPTPQAASHSAAPAKKGKSGSPGSRGVAKTLIDQLSQKIDAGTKKGGLPEQMTRLASQHPALASGIAGLGAEFLSLSLDGNKSTTDDLQGRRDAYSSLSNRMRETAQTIYPHRKEFSEVFDMLRNSSATMEAAGDALLGGELDKLKAGLEENRELFKQALAIIAEQAEHNSEVAAKLTDVSGESAD